MFYLCVCNSGHHLFYDDSDLFCFPAGVARHPVSNNTIGIDKKTGWHYFNAIWDTDPGLCNYVAGYFGVIPVDTAHDGNVATVEVNVNSAASCTTGGGTGLIDCGAPFPGAPAFHICGSVDGDGDFSVNALDFCTTPDCVTATGVGLPAGSVAVPVPMSAAPMDVTTGWYPANRIVRTAMQHRMLSRVDISIHIHRSISHARLR